MAVKMNPDIVAPIPMTKEKRPMNTAMSINGDGELTMDRKIFWSVRIIVKASSAPSSAPIPQ